MRNALLPFLRSRVIRNLVANYAGAAVNALAPLMTIPVLIRVLGQEQWGLVAFVNLLAAMMMMMNVGISQALVREFAHRWTDNRDDRLRAAALLRGYEGIYWFLALAIGASVLPFSPWIADQWLNTSQDIEGVARISAAYAVILFVATLPASIYRGTLLAVQEHILLNVIRAAATVGKVGIGLLIVLQTSSILAYLTVFVGISLLETVAMAIASWHFMPRPRRETGFHLKEVRTTLKFSATMSALVVLGVATTQIDRFFVSVLMPVEELGVYSIAVSLAFGILQISYPLFTSIMPDLVSIGADTRRRLGAIRNLLVAVLAISVILGSLYAALGQTVLSLWLGDTALAQRVAQPLTWLLLGSALNMVYNVGYTNWVSIAKTNWIAWVNILSLSITLIVLPQAIAAWGLVGATSSYVTVNIIGAVFTMIWLATLCLQEKKI